jgi:hypothetical protein
MHRSLSFSFVSIACALLTSSALAESKYEFKDTAGDHLDVLRDGKTLARWMYGHDVSTPDARALTYKPYLHVFDGEGAAPITKGPGGEFTHHRGLFLGWMKIGVNGKKYDRWHMVGGDQIHEKFLTQTADEKKASFTSRILWTGEKPDVNILEESRTLTFLPAHIPAFQMIDMTSVITAVAGDTTIDGDPEHAGLQFRPADEVDRTATVYTYPVANAQPHKDLDYPWVAESFTLAGKRHSVIYLSHPDNPKGAFTSAYRNYGRFGQFFKTEIPKGKDLTLKVRLLFVEGEIPPADWIQTASNEFTGKKDPAPQTAVKAAEGSKPAAPKK